MQALVLTKYNHLEIQDVPTPEPGAGEVRIAIKAVGICGSDVHGYDGSSGRRIPPVVMGHEASGVIDAVGPVASGTGDGGRWRIGDRVTFDSTVYRLDDYYTRRGQYNLSDGREVLGVSTPTFKRDGAFAEYVVVPVHILYAIPDDVSFEHAALVEPFGVAAHARSLAAIEPGDTAAVTGCGTIGLCLIQMLRAGGVTTIAAIDIDEGRREKALSIGATVALNPIDGSAAGPADDSTDAVADRVRAMTNGRGADVSFEAVGSSPALATAISVVRRGATVVLVGNIAPTAEIPLQKIVTEQIRLQGSCSIAGEFDAVLALMAAGRIDPDGLLSETAPLSEAPSWFERLYNKEPGIIKVILQPSA